MTTSFGSIGNKSGEVLGEDPAQFLSCNLGLRIWCCGFKSLGLRIYEG